MPEGTLSRHFTRRMLPLSVSAALLMAATPPAIYRVVAWDKLGAQAGVYASHVGENLRHIIEREPLLWRYNSGKIVRAAIFRPGQRDVAEVRITDCAGAGLFSTEGLGVTTGQKGGPSAWAPVAVHGRTAAWVQVRMDHGYEIGVLAAIAAVSSILGLALGLALFFYPVTVVRGQARVVGDTLRRIEAAEADIRAANRDLCERVAAATAEVRRLSERVVSIQEDERGRIARDIHDGIGQALAAVQIELGLAAAHPEEAAPHAARAADICEETIRDLRRVVHDLRPVDLGASTLDEALRAVTERFERGTGIETSFSASAKTNVPEKTATCILRVMQEALSNVRRHAAAHEVAVSLDVEGSLVRMKIEDDGRGFDTSAKAEGAGIRGIRERCAFLGGEALIESTAGGGTRVSVRLPIAEDG
ncbi:MAG: sensor histidine kinase [Deltaproteobacteria bacterium]|nr:sensor histidine kinase [Deltaproteobacteria bacterium]